MHLPPGFLAAIRSSPDDDLPRLAAADWLDEHGDPAWAELIRFQCELARLDPDPLPDDDLAKLARGRVRTGLEMVTPPAAVDHDILRLRKHELQLLDQVRQTRPGPSDALRDVFKYLDEPDLASGWRRGFREHVVLTAEDFLTHAAELSRLYPLLRHLTLLDPIYSGPALAACRELAGVEHLELVGGRADMDRPSLADSLAGSPHLGRLTRLTLWMEPQGWRSLVVPPTRAAWLAGVREVVFVQTEGEMSAGDQAVEVGERVEATVAAFNTAVGRPLARLERPFARRFPLDGELHYGLFAGHLPGGRPVLIAKTWEDGLAFVHFDADGRMVGEDAADYPDGLDPDDPSSDPDRPACLDPALLDALAEQHGFEPGPIFVREFRSELADVDVQIGSAAADAHDVLSRYSWVAGENFEIGFGNCYYAGPDGQIHTS